MTFSNFLCQLHSAWENTPWPFKAVIIAGDALIVSAFLVWPGPCLLVVACALAFFGALFTLDFFLNL